jgi:hypothetical protein
MEIGQVNGKAAYLASKSTLDGLSRRDSLINTP